MISWILLSILLAALVYTAFTIKREKSRYTRHGRWRQFCDYRLLIPPWWTTIQESPNSLHFERTDTYYDWMARFERRPCDPALTAKEIARAECARIEVEFDRNRLQQIADAHFVLDSECREELSRHSLRLEGTAKQFQTQRCHLDMLIIKRRQCPYYDLFSSWSSVLHGLIEGPYFDQVLKNLRGTTPAEE